MLAKMELLQVIIVAGTLRVAMNRECFLSRSIELTPMNQAIQANSETKEK